MVYYAVLRGWSYRRFATDFFVATFSSCLAILLTLVILCFQVASVEGSFRDGVRHIVYSFAARTHANPQNFSSEYTASLESGTAVVVSKYLKGTFLDFRKIIPTSWLKWSYVHLIWAYLLNLTYKRLILIFVLASGLLYFLGRRSADEVGKRKQSALMLATWFSILAPLSWFTAFKAHSYIHLHMNFIVWQMPFVFFGFAVCGLAAKCLVVRFAASQQELRLQDRNAVSFAYDD